MGAEMWKQGRDRFGVLDSKFSAVDCIERCRSVRALRSSRMVVNNPEKKKQDLHIYE